MAAKGRFTCGYGARAADPCGPSAKCANIASGRWRICHAASDRITDSGERELALRNRLRAIHEAERAAKNDVARRSAKNARLRKAGGAEQHQDGRALEIRHGLHDGQEIADQSSHGCSTMRPTRSFPLSSMRWASPTLDSGNVAWIGIAMRPCSRSSATMR